MASTRGTPADAPPPRADPTTLALLRDGGRPLLVALLVALAFKLVVAVAALESDPHARHPASDSLYYLERARGLAGLFDDPRATETFHLPPLYPWVLRLVPGAVQGEFLGVMGLQALAGTALLACTWLLARRRLPREAAFVALGLTFLYGPLTFYETKLLGDSLATALLIGLLVACDALHDRPAAWRGGLAGALLALAALLRPQALLLLPVLGLWALRRQRATGAALLLAAALLLLPSTLHNLGAGGGLMPVSDNGGVNLWLASTGPASGTFVVTSEDFGDIARQSDVARAVAEQSSGRTLTPAEISAWFTRAALGAIADDPGGFVHRLMLRSVALIESFETDVACIPVVEMHLIPPLVVLALPFGVLLGVAVAASLLGGRLGPAPRLPMLAVAGMVVLTALLFFHYSRFRLPLVPLLALAAASAWPALRAKPPGAGRALTAAAALAGVTLFSVWPATHHAGTRANGWATLGWTRLSEVRPGDRAGAEAVLADADRALQNLPEFPRAERLAGRACLLLRRFGEAGTHFDAALRLAPEWPEAQLDRALLLAIPDPSNPRHDAAAARELLPGLRAAATRDAQLAAGVAQLEAMLARQ
jgi:Dolichyl-phosphate-mannose-protein mannosyltransferase